MFIDNGIYTPHYSIGYLHGLLTFWGALYSNTPSSQIAIFFSIALFTNAQKYYNFVFLAFFLWANSFCVLCFYWSILALQCRVSFCCTATRISYVYMYIPSLWTCSPIPALQVITEPWAEPPVPCSSFLLAISLTRGGVCTSLLLSQLVLLSPFPPLCLQVRSLRLHLCK